MGFSYFQFYRYFTKVFAEPIAYTIFLIGFIIWKFGPNILRVYEKRFNLYTVLIIFIALLIYLISKFYL